MKEAETTDNNNKKAELSEMFFNWRTATFTDKSLSDLIN